MPVTDCVAGKVVAITGGTSGIGLALARCFAEAGASVVVCARSADRVAQVEGTVPGVSGFVADVTKAEDRAHFLAGIADKFGRLDILVSNAGGLIERDFAQSAFSDEALEQEFALNLLAPVQLVARSLREFADLEAIVLVTSGYALATPTRAPTYGAAKAGLHGFADGLRRQLKSRSVHVLEVLPPLVDTPAVAHREGVKVSPDVVARETLNALVHRRPRALVGAVGMLPLLMRLAPGMAANMIAGT